MHSVRCLGLSLSYKNIADWNNDYDESDTIDNNDNVGVNIILWKLQGPVIYKRSKPNRGFTQAVGLGDSFQKVWIN